MKVLLVDDDYLAIEGLQQMLNWNYFHGKLVGCAFNGIEALKLIRSEQPDVVISDIKMPEMDGLELAKQIHENFEEIYMILLSGYSEFDYARKALQYRVFDYILKPVTRQKISEIDELLYTLYEKFSQKNSSLPLTQHKAVHMHPMIASCFQIIDKCFTDPMFNISLLADTLHLSLPYLSTVFKQETGQTISSYLAQKRLEQAKKLLMNVSLSIKDVCLNSGYEDPRYFARSFKKHTGMTPSEYRSLHYFDKKSTTAHIKETFS